MTSDSTVYDFVFVTHLPSFYKTNLYNEIAKKHRVFVIFIGASSIARTSDFTTQLKYFDYIILNACAFERRSFFASTVALFKQMKGMKYHQLILGGWDLLEYWSLAWLMPKCNNYLALESSIFDSHDKGIKKCIKKVFLTRMRGVYYSGVPHLKLLDTLSYSGIKRKTGGVGIMHMPAADIRNQYIISKPKNPSKFLYVGRLAAEKNLQLLINVFNKLPAYQLTIVGDGPMKIELLQMRSENIRFIGHVANETLSQIYQSHDIFILPSLKEPWGLVVEEALYYGLPVIASQTVGSSIDLIEFYQAGKCFDPRSGFALEQTIEWMIEHFSQIQLNVNRIDFQQRALTQADSYRTSLQCLS